MAGWATAGHQTCVSPEADTVDPRLPLHSPSALHPSNWGPVQHARPPAAWGLAAASPTPTSDPPCVSRGLNTSYCSDAKSRPTLRSHGLQHSRLLCPSLSPGVCSDSSLLTVSASHHTREPTSITSPTSRPTPETRGPSGSRRQPQLRGATEHCEPWVFHHNHL